MFRFVLFVVHIVTVISLEQQKNKADPYFEEWKENAWKRPSQCHVCRLLVTEFYSALNRTNKKDIIHTGYHLDDSNRRKNIAYEKSEIRLMESMENVCDTMKSYVSRARRKFPYVKRVKSHFREGLDNLIQQSKAKLNIEAPPDMIDDNTKEIIRLKFKCVHMLERYEDDITDWYMNSKDEDLIHWLCKQRVLRNLDQGCLEESDELFAPERNIITTVEQNEETNTGLDQKQDIDKKDDYTAKEDKEQGHGKSNGKNKEQDNGEEDREQNIEDESDINHLEL